MDTPTTSHHPSPGVPGTLRAVWQRRRDEVLGHIDVVDAAIAALLGEAMDDDLRASAHQAAHELTGAAVTFGFPRASELARELELAFEPARALHHAEAPRLAGLAVDLRADLGGEPRGTLSTTTHGDCVLIVSEDDALARRLADEALERGLHAHVATDVTVAAGIAAARRPDVVVLDLHLPRQGTAALTLLEQLAQDEGGAPVVCVTATESFVDRIEVARRGGRGYLPRSLPAGHVLDVVDQLLRRRRASATRVIVVDDDDAVLSAVEALLSSHGVETTTLSDPLLLWDALEALDPDLVVLDVDMPEVGGIELCRVIRNEPRWSRLPILFLTARTDSASVHALFAAGADDYVPKPIVAPELLTRVTNRVERVALYRSLSDVDALTGVATRRAATETLERLLALSRRGQPLALGVIDLDHFKQVNDEHGHAVGDRVLQRVGALLQATFRGEDVVARWGGEEFAVGLYASGKEDAARRLERTLEVLRGERFTATDGRHFTVTFSGGVAEHPADADDLQQLFAAADTALYQAKAAGRDRVLTTGPG